MSEQPNSSVSWNSAYVAWCAATVIAAGTGAAWSTRTTITTSCEEAKEETPAAPTDTTTTTTYKEAPNPLWPSGISNDDVEALVQECLNDPTINIATIPDYLERQIYRSTILLTLNTLYQVLGGLHGSMMWGHELRLVKLPQDNEMVKSNRIISLKDSVSIADDVLEQVVDQLMANTAVNQPLIPDVIERQIYKNCLTLIFRLLDLLTSSLQLQCCGHVVGLQIAPIVSGNPTVQAAAVQQATAIDPAQVLAYARSLGVHPDEQVNDARRSFFDRFFRPVQTEMLAQLHATLYALILGILDDVLQHSQIRILSDTVVLDFVPVPPDVLAAKQQQQQQSSVDGTIDDKVVPPLPEQSSSALPLATFTAGLGMGMTLMVLLKRK
jgi:hypothetical protein